MREMREMKVRRRERQAPGARQRQALRRGARFRASTKTSQTCTRDCGVDALTLWDGIVYDGIFGDGQRAFWHYGLELVNSS